MLHPRPDEASEQFVINRDDCLDTARFSLPRATPKQLTIDARRLMKFSENDMQATDFHHFGSKRFPMPITSAAAF
jgi:hypothetical protein